jgi:D-beta-D-heptose 7-phosphate kinase/D-beta-D-heptose 1-phosphate adenosyltransferase
MKNEKIVFTNGCFYLLHPGHVNLFKTIKELYPDHKLIVGVNSAESIALLKKQRPKVMEDEDRIAMIAAIRYVDDVKLFDEATPIHLINKIKPNVIVKGADHLTTPVVGCNIADAVTFIKFTDKYSTTQIVAKIKAHDSQVRV